MEFSPRRDTGTVGFILGEASGVQVPGQFKSCVGTDVERFPSGCCIFLASVCTTSQCCNPVTAGTA